jgi:thiol-disulfide isomerase/thioredoxin
MMRLGDPMPSLKGATDWLNLRDEINIEEYLKNSPTLIYFWAVSCGICKDNFPKLRELKKKYEPHGLRVIAIHMPRYEADTDIERVKASIREFGIDEICAIDNLHKLREAFRNEQGWVPVYYLFDSEGKLKTRAAGEYGVSILNGALEKMFPNEVKQMSA